MSRVTVSMAASGPEYRRFEMIVRSGTLASEQIAEAIEALLPPEPPTLEEIGRAVIERAAAYHAYVQARASLGEPERAYRVESELLDRWFAAHPEDDR